jgi:chromosomal replication initiator protein|tara:strand:- start:56258 stop:57583 length:1326 start_codon:yes stop_codon:yes gene_type:complete
MHIKHWDKCLSLIKTKIGIQSFETWFKPIEPIKYFNDTLTLRVPNKFFYEWIEEHYIKLLDKIILEVLGEKGRIEYLISNKSILKNIEKKTNKILINKFFKDQNFNNLNNNYSFKNFIQGKCNSVARTAGKRIYKNPGNNPFNPLMIYGKTGLGKTHLIQAIGNKINDASVYYVTSEKFATQFIDSLKENKLKDFTKFYSNIDVLIIDDVQFFSGKPKTQEVFFHIFNQLNLNQKQIILSADKSPLELDGLEERLISRFKSGLTVELEKPDYNTRLNILKFKVENDNLTIPENVIEYIAYEVDSNIREIEGVLISLMAHSTVSKVEIDLNLAKSIINKIVKNTNREVDILFIQEIVSKYFHISIEEMKDKVRKKEIVIARQVAMYFSKDYTNNSLKSIGNHFGGRDHSTVIHAVQAVNDMIDTDKIFKKNIGEINKRLSSN